MFPSTDFLIARDSVHDNDGRQVAEMRNKLEPYSVLDVSYSGVVKS